MTGQWSWAADGIFDVLSDQEVADIVWRNSVVDGKDAVRNAREVVQAALRKGSRDNVTAVVLRLGWSPPPALDSVAAGAGSNPLADKPEPAEEDMFG